MKKRENKCKKVVILKNKMDNYIINNLILEKKYKSFIKKLNKMLFKKLIIGIIAGIIVIPIDLMIIASASSIPDLSDPKENARFLEEVGYDEWYRVVMEQQEQRIKQNLLEGKDRWGNKIKNNSLEELGYDKEGNKINKKESIINNQTVEEEQIINTENGIIRKKITYQEDRNEAKKKEDMENLIGLTFELCKGIYYVASSIPLKYYVIGGVVVVIYVIKNQFQ